MEGHSHDIAPEFVTVPEASRRLGLGCRQIRRAVDDGTLATYRVGGWPRVRLDDVRAWVLSTAVKRTGEGAR